MNIQTVFAVIAIIAAYAWIRYRQQKAEQAEQERAIFDSARLQGEIYALYRSAQELERLDRLIIDLRLCKPDELHRAFNISWSSSDGEQNLDFMASGSDANTESLMQLATSQRETVNEEIMQRICDIYSRAQEYAFFTEYNRERNAENCAENGDRGSAYASEG